MNKVLAVLIAGFFAVGAYAQQPKPAELDPTAKGKSADKAEVNKATRAEKKPGPVKTQTAGGQNKVSESTGGVAPSKSVDAGEARAKTRNDRRGYKAPPPQGGTPDMAGAK